MPAGTNAQGQGAPVDDSELPVSDLDGTRLEWSTVIRAETSDDKHQCKFCMAKFT